MLSRIPQRLFATRPFELTQALWFRLLGLIYIAAFGSLWPQITGLIGSKGVSPAARFMQSMHAAIGSTAYWHFPSLFWLGINDHALIACCVLGCVAGLMLTLGLLRQVAAAAAWILYLSVVVIGQPFTNFQWDALLLEAGFLALLPSTPLLLWAYRFLLFRLMFESGIVKLTSHDPNWANLHALRFHFMTQPLPNPLAYYAYSLPVQVLDSAVAITFFIEIVAPFFLFAPRKIRYVATGLILLLQVVIVLTGNYAFFNFLTIALCVWSLDENDLATFRALLRPRFKEFQWRPLAQASGVVVAMLIVVGLLQVLTVALPAQSRLVDRMTAWIAPFEIVNSYGLFAVMTTTRPEIVIEGSDDGQRWVEYNFRYKPGALNRPLPWVAPYHPRLDWQMWFAALGSPQENDWIGGLFIALLNGNSEVTSLMEPPPFSTPPHYLRALLYDYSFTTPKQRAATGNIWQRKLLGVWFGPVGLRHS